MPELSNRDIDDIFQRGAERYDFEFKEEAWQQMASLLERDRRRRLIWWWLTGIVLALLLSYTAYLLLTGHSQDAPAPKVQMEKQGPVAGAPEPPEATVVLPQDTERITGKSRVGESVVASKSIPENAAPSSGPAGSPNSIEQRPQPPKNQKSKIAPGAPPVAEYPPGKSESDPAEQASTAAPHPDPSFPPEKEEATAPPAVTELIPAVAPLPYLTPSRMASLPDDRPTDLPGEFVLLSSSEKSVPPAGAGKLHPENALTFGINFSPESASIGTDDFGAVDYKIGLSIDYRFSTHFGAGTGIHYTRKHYNADPGEYSPEKGFWTRQIAPEQSYGYCSMLEVPLNVTYFLERHDQNGLFLEAGFTNFIMLNEHYWYTYDRPDPDLIRYWQSNFEYHAWMSILNISPGYQMFLGSRFGLQAAPFIQIPLTGIGHGKVDLYSIGLNLRVLLRSKIK